MPVEIWHPLSITMSSKNEIVFFGDRYSGSKNGQSVLLYDDISKQYTVFTDDQNYKSIGVIPNKHSACKFQNEKEKEIEEYISFDDQHFTIFKYDRRNSHTMQNFGIINKMNKDLKILSYAMCCSLCNRNGMCLHHLSPFATQRKQNCWGFLASCFYLCVEFILCKENSVYVIEYIIVDDECELTAKQSFHFGNDVVYIGWCGMCVSSSMSECKCDNEFIPNEFKSNDDISNHKKPDEEAYDIILFGSVAERSFLSSLQWLSLKIVNNKSYVISIDNDKTKQFQNTDKARYRFENKMYRAFGYTKWKHYLILFGGLIGDAAIDSIFYFDFYEMKWHKSEKV